MLLQCVACPLDVRVRRAFPVACSGTGVRETTFDTRGSIPVCKPLRAASLRVSTLADSPDLCGGVLLSSPLLALRHPPPSPPPLQRHRAPSPPLLPLPHTQHNTSRTGGGKRDTCLALLSKRPIRAVGADHRAPPLGPRTGASTERATLRRVQTRSMRERSVAAFAARNNLRSRDFLRILNNLLVSKGLRRSLLSRLAEDERLPS